MDRPRGRIGSSGKGGARRLSNAKEYGRWFLVQWLVLTLAVSSWVPAAQGALKEDPYGGRTTDQEIFVPDTSRSEFPYKNELGKGPGQTEGQRPPLPPTPDLAPSAPVGTIPADFGVSDDGAATYTVPIRVPPGRMGIEPELSLAYSSRGTNGILGLRWSLEGLSAVTRTGRSHVHDGHLRRVVFDEWLRTGLFDGDTGSFALNGRRMEAVKGIHGREGTEYRTRQDDMAKIVSHADAKGVYGFTVYKKNGLIHHYGKKFSTEPGGDNAVMYARGGVPRAWLLREVEDRDGNYLEVEYRKVQNGPEEWDGEPGFEVEPWPHGPEPEDTEVVPETMRYTGNHRTGDLPRRTVEFVYQGRRDSRHGFFAGTRTLCHSLLAEIRCTRAGEDGVAQLVRRYGLAYDEPGDTQSPRLASITEYDGSGVAKPPTFFDWTGQEHGPAGYTDRGALGLSPSGALHLLHSESGSATHRAGIGRASSDILPIDVDGDGIPELVYPREGTVRILHGPGYDPDWTGGGFGREVDTGFTLLRSGCASGDLSWGIPLDYDADGRMDILLLTHGENWEVLRNTGSGFELLATGVPVEEVRDPVMPLGFFKPGNVFVHDLNGDGLMDVVTREQQRVESDEPGARWEVHEVWNFRLHDGERFGPLQGIVRGGVSRFEHLFMDVNGDGATELLMRYYDRPHYMAWFFTEHDRLPLGLWLDGTRSLPRPPNPEWFRDLPGEPGSREDPFPGACICHLHPLKIPVDVNGDGLDDILEVWQSNNTAKAFRTWVEEGLLDKQCGDSFYDFPFDWPRFWGARLWLNTGDGFIGGADGLLPFSGVKSVRERLEETARASVGTLGTPPPEALDHFDFRYAVVMDYNGDGREDILVPEMRVERDPVSIRDRLEDLLDDAPWAGNIIDHYENYRYTGRWKVILASGEWVGFMPDTSQAGRAFGLPKDLAGNWPDDLRFEGRLLVAPIVADFNGDLSADILTGTGSLSDRCMGTTEGDVRVCETDLDLRLVTREGELSGLLRTIREGSLGIEPGHADWDGTWSYRIDYKPTTDPDVYSHTLSPDAPPADRWRPPTGPDMIQVNPRLHVVSQVLKGNALDKPDFFFSYTYHDSRHDHWWGWLGFRQTVEREALSGRLTSSLYEGIEKQPCSVFYPKGFYPLVGALTRQWADTRLGSGGVHRKFVSNDHHWQRDGARYFRYLRRKDVQTLECPGGGCHDAVSHWERLAHDVVRNEDVDGYGNVGRVRVTHEMDPDTWEVTQVQYMNDETDWRIGLPVWERAESHTAVTFQHREKEMSYVPGTLRLERTVRQPGAAADLELTSSYFYDDYGHLERIHAEDKEGNVRLGETVEFDAEEGIFPVRTTNAMGHVTQFQYQRGLGVKTIEEGPNGVRAHWLCDGFARPVESWWTPAGAGERTRTSYERWVERSQRRLRVRQSTDTGRETVTDHDRLGRPVKVLSSGFGGKRVVQESRYDERGRLERSLLPAVEGEASPGHIDHTYDGLGRLLRRVDSNGLCREKNEYTGLVETATDARGNDTTIYRNTLGQVEQVVDAHGHKIRYVYGPFGKLFRVIDPRGNEKTTWYDAFGRLDWESDPDAGGTSYTYSAFGDLLRVDDANGDAVRMEYDELGRPVSRWDNDSGTERPYRFWYDHGEGGSFLGALHATESPWGHEVRYAYNAAGRVERERSIIAGNSYEQRFGYDGTGRLVEHRYPSQAAEPFGVLYAYDPQGNLEAVQDLFDPATAFYKVLGMDAAGRVTREFLGNGILTERSYDPVDGTLSYIVASAGADSRLALAYGYDDNRNLVQRIDQKGPLGMIQEDFSYDALDRLTTSRLTGFVSDAAHAEMLGEQHYRYDELGNLTWKAGVGTYVYGPAKPHAVSRVISPEGGIGDYMYDAVGNLVKRPGESVWYTHFNKPKRIEVAATGDGADFEYDAGFRRVLKRSPHRVDGFLVGGSVTAYVGGVYEHRQAGIVSAEKFHVIVNGRLAATVTRALSGGDRTQSVEYFLHDHLGSVTAVADAAGELVRKMYFDPFGQSRTAHWQGAADPVSGDWSGNSAGFCGHEHDDDLGLALINMQGREYDPVLGRFLSPDPLVTDPLNLQTHNRYSYVRNNPLARVDPTGYGDVDERCTSREPTEVETMLDEAAMDQLLETGSMEGFYDWEDQTPAESTLRRRTRAGAGSDVADNSPSPDEAMSVPEGAEDADCEDVVGAEESAGVSESREVPEWAESLQDVPDDIYSGTTFDEEADLAILQQEAITRALVSVESRRLQRLIHTDILRVPPPAGPPATGHESHYQCTLTLGDLVRQNPWHAVHSPITGVVCMLYDEPQHVLVVHPFYFMGNAAWWVRGQIREVSGFDPNGVYPIRLPPSEYVFCRNRPYVGGPVRVWRLEPVEE